MAIFPFSDAAFNMFNLDHHGVFQTSSTALTKASPGQLANGISMAVGFVALNTRVQIDVAMAQAFDLYGTDLRAGAGGSLTSVRSMCCQGR